MSEGLVSTAYFQDHTSVFECTPDHHQSLGASSSVHWSYNERFAARSVTVTDATEETTDVEPTTPAAEPTTTPAAEPKSEPEPEQAGAGSAGTKEIATKKKRGGGRRGKKSDTPTETVVIKTE